MKKILVLSITLSLCLAGCGSIEDESAAAGSGVESVAVNSSGDDNSSLSQAMDSVSSALDSVFTSDSLSESSLIISETDSEMIDEAKAVVTKFFELASKAEYSSAVKLCTEDCKEMFDLGSFTDGENPEEATVEFNESKVLKKDDEIYICLSLKVVPTQNPDDFVYGVLYVKYENGEYLLAGTYESVDNSDYVSKSKQLSADSNAKTLFCAANAILTDMTVKENGAVLEGTYQKDDDTGFIKMLNSYLTRIDFSCEYDYSVEFLDGNCTVTFYNLDENISSVYPNENTNS